MILGTPIWFKVDSLIKGLWSFWGGEGVHSAWHMPSASLHFVRLPSHTARKHSQRTRPPSKRYEKGILLFGGLYEAPYSRKPPNRKPWQQHGRAQERKISEAETGLAHPISNSREGLQSFKTHFNCTVQARGSRRWRSMAWPDSSEASALEITKMITSRRTVQ